MKKTNARGIAIIKEFESLKLTAYLCPAKVWTIGWGHTKGVREGDRITLEQAEALLADDLAGFERDVEELVRVPVTDNQFSALVSFAFNVGSDMNHDDIAQGLGDSTLLRKLNAGDTAGAAAEFLRWNRAGGKVLSGLTRRRKAERELFLTP